MNTLGTNWLPVAIREQLGDGNVAERYVSPNNGVTA